MAAPSQPDLDAAKDKAQPGALVPVVSRVRGPNIYQSPDILKRISPPGCRLGMNRDQPAFLMVRFATVLYSIRGI